MLPNTPNQGPSFIGKETQDNRLTLWEVSDLTVPPPTALRQPALNGVATALGELRKRTGGVSLLCD